MKRFLSVLSLLAVAVIGCRAVSPSEPQVEGIGYTQTTSVEDLAKLEVESLDPSIPIGDSFPIVIHLKNAQANQRVTFRLEGDGISPSQTELAATTDSTGAATVRVSGRSNRAKLNLLYAYADFEDGSYLTGELYVNFEPLQPVGAALQTEAVDSVVGEPTTFVGYVNTFPVVTSLEALESYDQAPGSGVVIKGVRFPGETLPRSKLQDITALNMGSATVETPPLSAQQSCGIANTTIRFTSWIDSAQQPLPTGTKVYIAATGNTPDQTRYLSSNGRLTFQVGCSTNIHLRLEAWTPSGMYIHSPRPNLLAWEYHLGGDPLTAASLQNKSYYLADAATDATRRNTLRVWYKINQVYNWELSTHNVYSSFPLSTVYPDDNWACCARSRAHFGRMYIEAGDGTSDRTLSHEFGHEVYYRRMMGASSYGGFHQSAVETNNTSFPICVGYVFANSYWANTEGCVSMIEGFGEADKSSGFSNYRIDRFCL